MSKAKFDININQVTELQKYLIQYGKKAEEKINNYLHGGLGEKRLFVSITHEMPISDRQKAHAKYSLNWGGKEYYNLAILIKTIRKFGYLYYPMYGEGTSRFNLPNEFMDRGVEKIDDKIINDILKLFEMEE